ncbi:MAG: DUF721 domain-containing protein [Thermodesulfobacteriota bacterium]
MLIWGMAARRNWGGPRVAEMRRADQALSSVLSRLGGEESLFLARLWKAWPEVVGPDIAALARPLGHRRTKLLLGVEDGMVMQEMVHYSPVVLAQANEFLGRNFFDKVELHLLGGQVPLDGKGEPSPVHRPEPVRPGSLGGLLADLPPDNPVGRAYRAYVEFFARRGTE